jgi:hypothetical protein
MAYAQSVPAARRSTRRSLDALPEDTARVQALGVCVAPVGIIRSGRVDLDHVPLRSVETRAPKRTIVA